MSPLIKIKKKISGVCTNSTANLKARNINMLSAQKLATSNQEIEKIDNLNINGRLRQSSQPDLLNTILSDNNVDNISIINKYLNKSYESSTRSLKNLNKIENPVNYSADTSRRTISAKSSVSNFKEILIDHNDDSQNNNNQ